MSVGFYYITVGWENKGKGEVANYGGSDGSDSVCSGNSFLT